MTRHGATIRRLPIWQNMHISLYQLFLAVWDRGGCSKVILYWCQLLTPDTAPVCFGVSWSSPDTGLFVCLSRSCNHILLIDRNSSYRYIVCAHIHVVGLFTSQLVMFKVSERKHWSAVYREVTSESAAYGGELAKKYYRRSVAVLSRLLTRSRLKSSVILLKFQSDFVQYRSPSR